MKIRNNILNKKLVASLLTASLALSAVGCGKTDNNQSEDTNRDQARKSIERFTEEETTEEKGVYISQEEYDALIEKIDSLSTETEESETEVATEEPYVEGELNVNNNESVQKRAEELFDEYNDYWENAGLDTNDIIDIIYVLNEKTTDAEGNCIIKNEEGINKVFNNINEIILPLDMIKKAEQIRKANEGYADEDGKIGEIPTPPSVRKLLDLNKGGAENTARKLDEYQDEIYKQLSLMNNEDTYDLESMNEFIRVIEDYDCENGDTGYTNTDDHSHLYLLAISKERALNLNGTMQPTDVLWVYDNDGYQLAKVSKTDEENKREDIIREYEYQYGVDIEAMVTALIERKKEGLSIDNQYILEAYDYDWLDEEMASIIANYALDESQMAYRKHKEIKCNHQNGVETLFFDEMGKESSKNNSDLGIYHPTLILSNC